MDDVGVDWRSLALLPFLRPDVVKLDRAVLADAASPEAARVVRGARAHISATVVCCSPRASRTREHERRARAFGARLGQGWRFGRPAPLGPERPAPTGRGLAVSAARADRRADAFPGAARVRRCRRRRPPRRELLAISMDLEREALAMRDPAVVLATFQHADHFTSRARERYAGLAAGAAFVAAFGVGLPPEPAPGVRGANLDDGEALADEWSVMVVGPHSALALIARDLGDTGRDVRPPLRVRAHRGPRPGHRAARALMLRVAAEPARGRRSGSAP